MMKKLIKHAREHIVYVATVHAIGGIALGFLLNAYFGIGGLMLGWTLAAVTVLLHLYMYLFMK